MQAIEHVKASFCHGCLLFAKQVRVFVQETFGIKVSSSWTWRFVEHPAGELQRARASPQEEARMNVLKELAKLHVENLGKSVKDIPAELIFTLDEIESHEWADWNPRDMIIPHQARPGHIESSVQCTEKRISCITTLSMAGDILMPLLIVHRKTIDDAVWDEGWRDWRNFLIRSNGM
jgi:hypothetical protein